MPRQQVHKHQQQSRNEYLKKLYLKQSQDVQLTPVRQQNIAEKSLRKVAHMDSISKSETALSVSNQQHKYSQATIPQKDAVPYNSKFIFHTKLPKAGSSTIRYILEGLAKKNHYYVTQTKGPQIANKNIVKYYQKVKLEQKQKNDIDTIVLIKHHYPFDWNKKAFQKLSNQTLANSEKLINPTYINVLRHPTSWFQSHYYFDRYGWEGDNRKKNWKYRSFGGSEADRNRTINQCIEQDVMECKLLVKSYFDYVCFECQRTQTISRALLVKMFTQPTSKKKNKNKSQPKIEDTSYRKFLHHKYEASTMRQDLLMDYEKYVEGVNLQAKNSLLHDIYVIGILEEFIPTLKLFEKMLPNVFKGAIDYNNTPKMVALRVTS